MSKRLFAASFAIGLAAVGWVAWGFVGTSALALAVTAVIAAAFLAGAFELRQFRAHTEALRAALDAPAPATLHEWLDRVPAALRPAARLRIEGERSALPGPALTGYLVGLLVMLGMLGTFLGMVVTFRGAVFALQGSTDLQVLRSALAEPIRGLGLSFGTSVAGVAASAMLGLMAAVSRRERVEASRLLDARIATVLRPFSAAHQREEAFRALQAQGEALPRVAEALGSLIERIEARSQQLDRQLLEGQSRFQDEVRASYLGLAQSVDASLKESLVAGAEAAGAAIRPAVEEAMAQLVRQAQDLQQHAADTAQAQVAGLTRAFEGTARSVADGWDAALQQHARSGETLTADLRAALASFATTFEARSTALLADVRAAAAEQQQAAGAALERIAEDGRTGLAALREDESRRGEAAVRRLDELQEAVARHLATLGAALEAPITRLLHTASEVPQAAAGVIAQLREEMGRVAERDNLALQERSELVAQLGTLLQSLQQASGEQRAAVEALVASASGVLQQAGEQFAQALQAQAGQAGEMAAHVSASAVELASVAEAFGDSVRSFQASNDGLAQALQGVEASLARSTARSDEQLAYYVAQAREVIDLSIASQEGLVENLRRLQARPAAAEAAGS
jgi:hypothetical protein